jgi:hypothetical protein
VTASSIRLAGPYVAYVEVDVEALGEVPFATVVDVRTGRLVRHPQGSDAEDAAIGIVGLVLTARGTEAWIARDCVRSATEPTTCAQPMTTEYRVTLSDATTGTSTDTLRSCRKLHRRAARALREPRAICRDGLAPRA